MAEKTSVLIVDDEATIVASLLLYFSNKGYDVAVSNSSGVTVSSISPHGFDVIITDLKMEPVDGLELIRNFRDGGFRGKIILMSASPELSSVEMENIGIDAFFEKPFETKELFTQICEWTKNLPAGTPAAVLSAAGL